MDFFNKKLKSKQSISERLARQKILTYIFLATGAIFVMFTYGQFLKGKVYLSIAGIFLVFCLLLSILLLRKSKEHFAETFLVILIIGFSLLLFLTNTGNITDLYWIYLVPPFVLFLRGKFEGSIWIVIMFSIICTVDLLSIKGYIDLRYARQDIRLFLRTLFFLFLTVLGYQSIYENNRKRLKEKGKVLSKVNNNLKNEIVKHAEVEKKLKKSLNEAKEKQMLLEDTKKAMLNLLDDLESEKDKTLKHAQKLKRFKEAVENTSEQIIMTTPEGIIIYANKALKRITGYKKDEVIGKTPTLWGGQMSKEFYRKFWDTIKNKKEAFRGDIKNKRKNGEVFDADMQVFPILDKKNNVKFYVGIVRDITREKEVDRMKTEFVSIASHQLRTPLTSIKWYIELMLEERDKLPSDHSDFIKEIYESNERMIELVNDLLNVSRIETGRKFNIVKKKINFVRLLKSVLKEERIDIEEKSIEVKFSDNFPQKYIACVDKQKIRQVLHNLLTNAVKYNQKNGEIDLGFQEDKKNFTFTITDTGMGIPHKQRKNVFKKFFRAENVTKSDTTGSGLGLYIAKAIIEAHKGKITFESEINKGTKFIIKLPRCKKTNSKKE